MGKDLWFQSRMLPFLWQGVSALRWASQGGGDFPQFAVCVLLYSMWFGKAAEVFILCQEALGFVWWPRDSRRAECGESQAPASQSPQSQRLHGLSHQFIKGDKPQFVVKISELFLDHLAAVLQRKTQEETNLLV